MLESFQNETSFFCRIFWSVYLSKRGKEKKRQATLWHNLLNRIQNPVLLVEVASIPVKVMKLCICTS